MTTRYLYSAIQHRSRSSFLVAIPVFFLLLLIPISCTPADEMTSTILVGASRIDVHIENGPMQLADEDLMQWVRNASDSVAVYYGRFPVPNVALRVIPSDWMLTHEMVHLAFPSVEDDHHWMEEGTATYVEPIARVRAKHMDAHEMWFELVRDLPQGLPQSGDQGLDNTHTWGRTYWGGALFCFLADVEIHKQTNNKEGLDDALRGILDAGGDIRHDWPLVKALETGDKATSVSVLVPLYEKMKNQSYDVDLDAIWRALGVERDGNTVQFVDSAPLAKTREAITFGSSTAKMQPASNAAAIDAGRRSRSSR
jgi:hypothetical protein